MRNLIPALLFALLTACSTIPVSNAPKPNLPETPVSSTLDAIRTLAANSACAKYDWQEQGVAPLAYTKGMALAYARAICQANPDVSRPLTSDPEAVQDDTDAISWFHSNFVKAGIWDSPMARKVYVLMMGEGMRESSGRYCCGRDASADNTDADSAEAGLFQTSWDSHEGTGGEAVTQVWNAKTSNCLDDFKQGIECESENLKNWGDPGSTGYAFQKREKDCPAFAADYAAVMFRRQRRHYYPLNAKTAELAPACDQMLAQVEQVMKANPGLCGAL